MRESLCETCVHLREILTPKGSRFLMCTLSATDDSFPKYPRQPLVVCDGYKPGEASENDPECRSSAHGSPRMW
jgi:hypothetical protein